MLPYVASVIVGILASVVMDALRERSVLSTVAARKISMSSRWLNTRYQPYLLSVVMIVFTTWHTNFYVLQDQRANVVVLLH